MMKGLRSIRYYKEIEGIDKIVVNDIDPQAVETIKRNLAFNNVPQTIAIPNLDDATYFFELFFLSFFCLL